MHGEDHRDFPGVVDFDTYDLAAWKRAIETSPALEAELQSGLKLFDGFWALGCDLFAAFFKYTFTMKEVTPAEQGRTALTREVVGWVRSARGLERLRAETVLDESRAAFATLMVLKRVNALLADPERVGRSQLLNQFEISALEQTIEDLEEQLEDAQELAAKLTSEDGVDRERFQDGVHAIGDELEDSRRRLEALTRAQSKALERLPAAPQTNIRDLIDTLPERLDANDDALSSFSADLGLPGGLIRGSAAAKLSLGDRLLQNPKLRRLAGLVGAFREFAQAVRRQRFERRPAEFHDIKAGNTIARVLPSEFSLYRHPTLRKDFLRRMAEGQLLQYAVTGQDKGGRGPMIVCIDASGSMRGEKEVWSKAIALTLLEIARKQKRHFRAIVFSGGRHDMRVFDLLERPSPAQLDPPGVPLERLMDFAECFQGGGTDFEAPLNKALALLEEQALRHGDVVFVTDGEAHTSETWLANFLTAKKRLEFLVYSVLVDVQRRGRQQPPSIEAVRGFSDRITTVTQLTADSVRELFIKL